MRIVVMLNLQSRSIITLLSTWCNVVRNCDHLTLLTSNNSRVCITFDHLPSYHLSLLSHSRIFITIIFNSCSTFCCGISYHIVVLLLVKRHLELNSFCTASATVPRWFQTNGFNKVFLKVLWNKNNKFLFLCVKNLIKHKHTRGFLFRFSILARRRRWFGINGDVFKILAHRLASGTIFVLVARHRRERCWSTTHTRGRRARRTYFMLTRSNHWLKKTKLRVKRLPGLLPTAQFKSYKTGWYHAK